MGGHPLLIFLDPNLPSVDASLAIVHTLLSWRLPTTDFIVAIHQGPRFIKIL